MRTKIVFTLVSDDFDIYLEQNLVSAYSARMYNPDAVIVLVVDQYTNTSIVGKRSKILEYVTEKVVVSIPGEYNKKVRSRYLKTYVRSCIEGDFIYLDGDTVVTASLDELDFLSFNVAAVRDQHLTGSQHPLKSLFWGECRKVDVCMPEVYFNSGVIYTKDNSVSRQLYDKWHRFYLSYLETGVTQDQPTLAKADSECGYVIGELEGIWNCQINYHGLPFLYDAKIIHYMGSNRTYHISSYYFFLSDVYWDIKQLGYIPETTRAYIRIAKSAFDSKCVILAGKDVEELGTMTYRLVSAIYFKHPKLFRALELVSRTFYKIVGK